MNIVFKRVQQNELHALHKIVVETFESSFAHLNDPNNFEAYVTEKLSDVQLGKELSNPSSLFFFLVLDGKVSGYLKLNHLTAQTEQYIPNALEVERIYLLPHCQGMGIGKLMIDKAIEVAREERYTCIWLGVWQKNEGAIRFYKREGFEIFGEHIFMMGSDAQTDLMMKLELVKFDKEN